MNLPDTPLPLFRDWLGQAEACEAIQYATAMCLSTVDGEGLPDGRIVLLHDVSEAGFAFSTDVRSAKGVALAHNPAAALTFYWGPLERQIRIRGGVMEAPATTADRLFQKRPRRSQFTAWASEQSQPIDSRTTLDERIQAAEARFNDLAEIPRPPYWQAYLLVPRTIEFWQAAARRLHDRHRYTRTPEGWLIERLAP